MYKSSPVGSRRRPVGISSRNDGEEEMEGGIVDEGGAEGADEQYPSHCSPEASGSEQRMSPVWQDWRDRVDVSVGGYTETRERGGDRHGKRLRCDPAAFRGHVAEMWQKDVRSHWGCVNSVEFDRSENLLVSGGDDCRVLVWHTSSLSCHARPRPAAEMNEKHESNIFTHLFTHDSTQLFSGGLDCATLLHNVETKQLVKRYRPPTPTAVHNLSYSSGDSNLVAVTLENGGIAFIDTRNDGFIKDMIIRERCMAGPLSGIRRWLGHASYYSAQFHPAQGRLLATTNDSKGVQLFDIRRLDTCLVDISESIPGKGAMFAAWNETGDGLAIIRSRRYPEYIDFVSHRRVTLRSSNYKNLHTVKSVSWAGPHRVITGSDQFGVFSWDVRDARPCLLADDSTLGAGLSHWEVRSEDAVELKGHRSIVNHVKWSERGRILVSSGVEKIVKVWSSLPLNGGYTEPRLRVLAGREGRDGERAGDDESDDDDASSSVGDGDGDENEEEDTDMLRHFDAVVTRGRHYSERMMVSDQSSDGEDSDVDDDYVVMGDGDNIDWTIESEDDEDYEDEDALEEDDDDDGGEEEDVDGEEIDEYAASEGAQEINEWPPRHEGEGGEE